MTNRESDVTIVMRARDEASDEIQNVERNAQDMRTTFLGLNRTMALLGLGSLSLGLGLRGVVGRSQELMQTMASSDLAVGLLGQAVEDLRDELRSDFGFIADKADVLRSDVEEAFTAMALAAGPGAALNIGLEELQGAFDIAASTGASFSEAAAAVGEALKGNLDPLRELLGVDMLPSLATIFEEAALAAAGTRDELTDVQQTLGEVGDGFAELGRRILVEFVGPFAEGIAGLMEQIGLLEERASGARSFVERSLGLEPGEGQDRIERELERFRETGQLPPFEITPPGFGGSPFGGFRQRPGQPSLGQQYREWLEQQFGRPGGQIGPPLPPGGVSSAGSIGAGGVPFGFAEISIVINGDVNDERTVRDLSERIMDRIREAARRGEFP